MNHSTRHHGDDAVMPWNRRKVARNGGRKCEKVQWRGRPTWHHDRMADNELARREIRDARIAEKETQS